MLIVLTSLLQNCTFISYLQCHRHRSWKNWPLENAFACGVRWKWFEIPLISHWWAVDGCKNIKRKKVCCIRWWVQKKPPTHTNKHNKEHIREEEQPFEHGGLPKRVSLEGNGTCRLPHSQTQSTGTFGTPYFSSSLSKRQIENRRCSEKPFDWRHMVKEPIRNDRSGFSRKGAFDSSNACLEGICPAWGINLTLVRVTGEPMEGLGKYIPSFQGYAPECGLSKY